MSSIKIERKRKKIQKLEKARKHLIELLLADDDLIEGNLCDILVRCGRSGCHCEKKPAHHVTRLGTREDDKIKNKVVRVDDREKVRRLVQTYKEYKQALKKLEQLEMEEKEIIKSAKAVRQKRYQ